MNVVIENTIYSLFIYMLLRKEWKNDIYILNRLSLPQLKEGNVHVLDTTVSFRKNRLLFYKNKLKLMIFLFRKKVLWNSKVKVYGNFDLMKMLFVKRDIYILEDGLINYEANRIRKKGIKKIFRLENPFISREWIKKIYLTGLAAIPKDIEDKVEIIQLKKLWKEKTEEEQQEILDLFYFSLEKLEALENRKQILFTQPLSEDGITSEAEKVELYRAMIKQYEEENLVIKTHPREKTNYQEYFPNVAVITEKFPAELLAILGIEFEKAITLFSTAALSMNPEVSVDFYGTEAHPKLMKEFGSMEKIKKTNCWIEKER